MAKPQHKDDGCGKVKSQHQVRNGNQRFKVSRRSNVTCGIAAKKQSATLGA
jgi:hypothetical protein